MSFGPGILFDMCCMTSYNNLCHTLQCVCAFLQGSKSFCHVVIVMLSNGWNCRVHGGIWIGQKVWWKYSRTLIIIAESQSVQYTELHFITLIEHTPETNILIENRTFNTTVWCPTVVKNWLLSSREHWWYIFIVSSTVNICAFATISATASAGVGDW